MSDINVTLTEDVINVSLWTDDINVTFPNGTTWPPWPALAKQHNQGIALSLWTINHNLNTFPAGIVVIDSGGINIVNFHIEYIDNNTLTLEFSGETTGTAYLS